MCVKVFQSTPNNIIYVCVFTKDVYGIMLQHAVLYYYMLYHNVSYQILA